MAGGYSLVEVAGRRGAALFLRKDAIRVRELVFTVAADQDADHVRADGPFHRQHGNFIQGRAQIVGYGPIGSGGDERVKYIADGHNFYISVPQCNPSRIARAVAPFMVITGGNGRRMIRVL